MISRMTHRIFKAIGLMSGTSLDGIDIALIETDGYSFVKRLDFKTYTYAEALRDVVRGTFGYSWDKDGTVATAEKLITQAHIDAVRDFGHRADVIGFHGQTIFHDPKNKITWQIGNGPELAEAVNMNVVYDFRTADVKAGGQGAPFMPLYHQVLAKSAGVKLPCAVLNIGGVANLTWLGEGDDEVIAFDTGPGNALLDDWILQKTGKTYDENGSAAMQGYVNEAVLAKLLVHPYFKAPAPKSLDRQDFTNEAVKGLPVNDGAATLAAFTVDSIVKGFEQFPGKPHALYVTGGGRKNHFMMRRLEERLKLPIHSVDALGWNGDSLEAEGFAYLAVRSVLGLPLSLPLTTGVPQPMRGGQLVKVA